MGTKYITGTAGRLKSAILTPDLTTSMIDFSGAGATAINAEINGWTLQWQREGGQPMSLTFESSTDAQGSAYADLMRGGIATWSASFKGLFNADPASAATNSYAKFPVGAALVFDLIKFKTGSLGFAGCKGVVQSFATGAEMGGRPNEFQAQVQGSGALPTPTF